MGAVEGLHCLARVVVAEEGADLLQSFLAVVAEVVVDLLCLAVVVEDLRSVMVVAVADPVHPFREVVAAVGVLENILHSFQGVVEGVRDLYYLEEEAVEGELQY